MNTQYEKMRFINYMKPILSAGKYTVSATQNVVTPQSDEFHTEESFYVASRAYTLDTDTVFSVSPSENEVGDLSHMIPFITLKRETLPWEYKISDDINGVPVPWVALIVISADEKISESDMTVRELLSSTPPDVYFPEKELLPETVMDKEEDVCHVLDIPKDLYFSIMPGYEDMICLTHARRVNLADTEDNVAAMDGDFSVVMANRFVPSGENEILQSTVHLVSMIGAPREVTPDINFIRLVSLYRFHVFSVCDQSESFGELIESLSKNTGSIGYDQNNEILRRCYLPKKHYTRSGECTYSLYRPPFIPYDNSGRSYGSKHTADGHLIYDPENGVLDVSYAAAFQIGRLISLNSATESKKMTSIRNSRKMMAHQIQLNETLKPIDIPTLLKNIIKDG